MSKIRSQSQGSDSAKFRITVFGGSRVGKSAIILRYLHGSFEENCPETIEDLHRKDLNINGFNVALDILDTSGHKRFSSLRKLAISSSDAFLLVYSLSDKRSFEEVEKLRQQITSVRGNVPIVIVANKADMATDLSEVENISLDALVSIEWDTKHIKTSAKHNVNIEYIFNELIQLSKLNILIDINTSRNTTRTHLHRSVSSS